MLDVVQISYHEEYADENFEILKLFAPFAKRVQGVKGIFNAHKAAAKLSETSHFYVIDADAVISERFSFEYRPRSSVEVYPGVKETDCVHVWRSINPVNELIYGYGGAKLFPRKALLEARNWNVDMTTTIGCPFRPQMEISNITAFNTSPFDTWKSAFRECTKLASSIIPGGDNIDNQYRMDIWCTKGKKQPYGPYAIMGANQGRDFGTHYRNDLKSLNKINDFQWLQKKFDAVKDDV